VVEVGATVMVATTVAVAIAGSRRRPRPGVHRPV